MNLLESLSAPLKRLFGSSKVMIAMICISFAFVALLAGRITWDEVLGLLKWLVPALIGSIAMEDAAGKLGTRVPSAPVQDPPSAGVVSDPTKPNP
jgi:hypothetical protein